MSLKKGDGALPVRQNCQQHVHTVKNGHYAPAVLTASVKKNGTLNRLKLAVFLTCNKVEARVYDIDRIPRGLGSRALSVAPARSPGKGIPVHLCVPVHPFVR